MSSIAPLRTTLPMRMIKVSCLLALVVASTTAAASEVRVWGDKATVATYDPAKSIFNVPAILATQDVVDLAVGPTYALALTSDGQVIAWGASANAYQAAALMVPATVQRHVVKLATNGTTSLVLTDTGVVTGWGSDYRSMLSGIPSTLSGIIDIGIGNGCAFAWKADGTVVTWGDNQVAAPIGTLVLTATGNDGMSIFAKKSDGSVQAWGATGAYPTQVPPTGLFVTSIVTGALGQFAALQTNHEVVVWGDDESHLSAVPGTLTNAAQVALATTHALACCTDGSLVTWGDGITATNGLGIPSGWNHAVKVGVGFGFSLGLFSQPPNGSAPIAIEWKIPASIIAGAPVGTDIGLLDVIDADPGDRHVISLVPGVGDNDNARISLVGNRAQVAGVMPGNTSNLTLRVRAIDSGGLMCENILNIAVNAAPVANSQDNGASGGCGMGSGIGIFLAFSALIWLEFSRRRA